MKDYREMLFSEYFLLNRRKKLSDFMPLDNKTGVMELMLSKGRTRGKHDVALVLVMRFERLLELGDICERFSGVT